MGAALNEHRDPIDRAMILSQDGWGRIIALIAAADGDLAGAEDALSSALERAVRVWREQGVPTNPEGWLYRVALNARRDVWKSAAARTSAALDPEVHDGADPGDHDRSASHGAGQPAAAHLVAPADPDALPDRRLELLGACAHPDIEPGVRPLLMLSAVMGMTGTQIAAGMALPAATVAARLTRAKKRIAALGIGFGLPDRTELEARLPDIHEAIYGAFAIDWVHAASEPRDGIIGETLYLSRLLAELCPSDGESHGLAALIHLSAARFPARRSPDGEFVPLGDQDPGSWDSVLISRGEDHLRAVQGSGEIGRFGLQAAIQILHMSGVRSGSTDWPMLLRLHDDVERMAPSLGGAVARAAVIAEIDGPEAGLAELDALDGPSRGESPVRENAFSSARVDSFQPTWALRAHLLARAGQGQEAQNAYRRAIELTTDPAERAYLEARSLEA
ncbi:MAG: RNA polymerase [Brevibacterium aurantiacum]|nr:RNA polymerase [Brevibacterium aurantiacum]